MDDAARHRLTQVLFASDAPWTLLVLTGSTDVAALCGRTLQLPGVDSHA
jgi:putative ABC transport system ATP-binding protein